MADEKLTSSLTESILTALAFSEDKSASVLAALDPKRFEPPYDDVAARCIEFRARYGKPPGREHIDDVFDHILGNPRDRRQQLYSRLLMGLMEQADGLNLPYVISRVQEFVRKQTLKAAIIEAGELYSQASTQDIADQVEAILAKAMNTKLDNYDPGVFASEERALNFLDQDEGDYLAMGIPEFDSKRFCPVRGELILYMAPRKTGKSMWCINLAKRALTQHWKTLYITLEMSEKRVMQRLYQSFFGVTKRGDQYERMLLDLNSKGVLVGLDMEAYKPRRHLGQPNIREFFKKEARATGELKNLLVKQFPSGSLTVRRIEAYMDQMEALHNFIPDLLIVDYPDLMKKDMRNPLESTDEIFVDLRGLGQARNMAVATPTQTNRASDDARRVRGSMIAGTIGKLNTCDVGFTYSATDAERKLGLARLFLAAGRGDEDRFTVLIEQDYRSAQWVLNSVRMEEGRYFDILKNEVGRIEGDDSERDAAE
jgi:hypothetical protein